MLRGDLRPRPLRSAFLVASVLASLAVPTRGAMAGGAVVPVVGRSDPTVFDVRVAVAHSPTGTTRWSEVTVPASSRSLWLVPARPGASVAWAANGWLPALEEATAPRILRPAYSSSCTVQSTPERTPPSTVSATKQSPATYVVHATVESIRAAADSAGFAIDAELDERITSLYSAGWNLVAVEIAASGGAASTSTIRVTDDGGAVLPLALSGSRAAETRVTAFSIGVGVMTTVGAVDIDDAALSWGKSGSNFTTWRRGILQGADGDRWLRESASHAALFYGTPVAGASATASVAAQYLGGSACATSAQNAGDSDAVVGQSLPASTFACGGLDDLAIALDGLAPRTAVVTRWSGVVNRGDLGVDRPIGFDPNASQILPARRAGTYESCSGSGASPPRTPLTPGPTGGPDDEVVVDGPDVVYVGDGCGGGTTTTTTYEEDDTTTTSSSDDGCGGDTTTTTSSGDGWDSSDDADSCDSDTSSSSSSSDSCDSGGDSGDGWDTADDMGTSAKKTSMKATPKRSKSPFSRYALFAVALLLPLRRRARDALERR